MNCYQITRLPIVVVAVNVVEVHPFFIVEEQSTLSTCMMLSLECPGCGSVVFVGVSLAPVDDISVEGAFVSLDIDVFVFRIRNAWECLIY